MHVSLDGLWLEPIYIQGGHMCHIYIPLFKQIYTLYIYDVVTNEPLQSWIDIFCSAWFVDSYTMSGVGLRLFVGADIARPG
jgi:hypothetical protein